MCGVAVSLLSMGCGTSTPGTEIDASTAPADATAQLIDAPVAVVDAALIDAPTPSPVTFQLAYFPSIPPDGDNIYVQIACSQLWVRVIDSQSNAVPIDSDCGLCRCDACESCAVCDCALLIEPIPQNSARNYDWDGVTHPTRNEDGCGVCSFDSTLAAGTYTARFCWSFTSDGPQVCADESFDYPLTTTVQHIVTGPSL